MTIRGRESTGFVPPSEGSVNRGHDTKFDALDAPPLQVTLEFINETLLDYLKNVINPTIDDNGNARPVDVMYGTAERWAAVRQYGFLRDDQNQKMLAPLIMLRRNNVTRTQPMNPSNKYMYTSYDLGWNARNPYDKFAVLNGVKPSQKFRTVMIPDYMELLYDVVLWTEYQEQMDVLIEQINVEAEEFWGRRNNFKFRVSINEFISQSDLPTTSDRIIRTNFQMKVFAYLIPERMVKNFKLTSTSRNSYTAKKVVAITEVVGTGKILP